MPRKYHTQATFNDPEWKRVKKVKGLEKDEPFLRKAVFEYVERRETKPAAGAEPSGSESGQDSSENRGIEEGNGTIQATRESGDPFED